MTWWWLDALHQIRTRIEMQQRHEPAVQRHRLFVTLLAGETE
jgi:hypothetical protein